MREVSRSCARPGCSLVAVATMSYVYADGVVVLEPLAAEAHPMVHDLCRHHAEAVRVPRGWQLEDRWVTEGDLAGQDHLDLVGA